MLATLLASLALVQAVDRTPTEAEQRQQLQERRAEKLSSAFLALHPWHRDLESARRAAAREGKPILVHCTRSFVPCGTSIRFEREVLSDPAFAAVADRAVLYCHVTSHLDATADRALFEYRGAGWPHHVVLDATGRMIAWEAVGEREKTLAVLHELVDRAEGVLHAEHEAAAAIAAARLELFDTKIRAGALPLAEAQQLYRSLPALPAARVAEYTTLLCDLEVRDLVSRIDRFDESVRAEAGKALYDLYRAGKRPGSRDTIRDYWGGIMHWIEERAPDRVELHAEGLAALEERFGENRGYRTWLEQRRQAHRSLAQRAR